jgi:vacuolar-type H+-ATPase subunit I/STV1
VISESIAQLEDRVATNTAELDQMRHSYGEDEEDFALAAVAQPDIPDVTDEDIERELAKIRELEQRKRRLEERVTGMDRDMGGLIG